MPKVLERKKKLGRLFASTRSSFFLTCMTSANFHAYGRPIWIVKKHVCKVLVCLHVVLGSELEFGDASSKRGLVIFGG